MYDVSFAKINFMIKIYIMQKTPKNKKILDKWQNILFYFSIVSYPVFLFFVLVYFNVQKIGSFFNITLFLHIIFFLPIILLFNSASSAINELTERLGKKDIEYDAMIDAVLMQQDEKNRETDLKVINRFYLRTLLFAAVQGMAYGFVIFALGVLFLGSDFVAGFL